MKAKNNSYYIAFSIRILDQRNRNIQNTLKCELEDSLKSVINKGYIKDLSIYKHKKAVEKHGEFASWNYLIITEIPNVKRAGEVKEILASLDFSFIFEKIRLELLVTTPQSTYPIAQAKAKKRIMPPFFAVEYVDVNEKALKEFQDIMILNNGPSMKYIMKHANWCYNFYALETVEVYYHNTNAPTWNQIHIIGLFLNSVIHYKKDFSKGLKEASGVSFEENFKRLKEIRIMLYKSIGKKIM